MLVDDDWFCFRIVIGGCCCLVIVRDGYDVFFLLLFFFVLIFKVNFLGIDIKIILFRDIFFIFFLFIERILLLICNKLFVLVIVFI